MQRIGSTLYNNLPVVQVYGANTNVGKTIVSTLLCRSFEKDKKVKSNVHYIKPVSTGPLSEADDSHVSRYAKNTASATLFQFSQPLSPHLAARYDGKSLPDVKIQQALCAELRARAAQGIGRAVVETAGGVLSPAPSGTAQADLYRPLRLPVVLVGDHKLGGIATTISAYESLRIRGYDLDALVLFQDEQYRNFEYLRDYFSKHNLLTLSIPPPPPVDTSPERDHKNLREYYENVSASDPLNTMKGHIVNAHATRINELLKMAKDAHDHVWYPFTQHKGRSEKDILTIDSAFGDDFQALKSPEHQNIVNTEENILAPAVDGSASWWTQGLGHGNTDLTLAAAYASGRYGHVMFASAINEPALNVVKKLLDGHQNPRLDKVFYTDNGSTGMEVAIKMALRASCVRYGWDHRKNDISILGLRGSYHGDTMGVVDAAEPSVYNDTLEWYKPRGFWFEYPEVRMRKGKWYVEPPAGLEHVLGESQEFLSLDDVLSGKRDEVVGPIYEHYIKGVLSHLVQNRGYKFGGLVLEPLILGAGGMHFCDPAFQRALIQTIRQNPELIDPSAEHARSAPDWSGLPVVFDEVFTGLYRLGQFNCNKFLHAQPDIVVNAKLLTGGLVPLCTTSASRAIFDAFLSDSKADSLLHGHSYTAHAVGCSVASASLSAMQNLEKTNAWDSFKESWKTSGQEPTAWSMWSKDFVEAVSFKAPIDHVFALGSVLAIAYKDSAGSGYTSVASQKLHKQLLQEQDGWMIHNRVLGNVIYFMTGQTSTPEHIKQVEERILHSIQ
ncbi:dethiobiotin synthase [Verruconis gallopava]|uniref:Dethiobiotin synthase n=1 Tax=Verruconis gallopava TaxID=253628 RepID=A0A0D2A8W3_9PEZI|nr:dethiobiotin synthase [Verruconis gallopava]KIW03198.1 dethiobiotin synthase [Verruconis gallopava]